MKPWLVAYQQRISQQIVQQRMPHAILVTGKKGAGKSLLIHWLKSVLMCEKPLLEQQILTACEQCKTCHLMLKATHPDCHELQAEKATIGVDEIRKVSQFLQLRPQLGTKQCAVIQQADIMTVAASNALLKTLEEPSIGSYLLLSATDSSALLATITSRCWCLPIYPPVGQALLQSEGLNSNDPFINVSFLETLTDKQSFEHYLTFVTYCKQAIMQAEVSPELQQFLLDVPEALQWFETLLVNLYRQSQQWQIDPHVAVELKQTPEQLFQLYQAVIACKRKLSHYNQANRSLMIMQLVVVLNQLLEQ
jgi:DNA polymerase-3 subunit delta'